MYPYEMPANFGIPKSIFNRLVLAQVLRNADGIACVSEATRSQLRRYAPIEIWRKSVQICNCVEAESRVATASPIPGWNGEPFLLCVAQHRKNKNIPVLIRTFQRLLQIGQITPECHLVVVGIAGPETALIRRAARAAGLDQSIRFLEGLSDPELQWCYRKCDALVAPSITEGFGLPVAEALLAGCRVVCSDIPAHREIGGSCCKFVSLQGNAVEALALGITEALREPKQLPVVLPEFSASTLAKQYVALYRRVIATARSERHAEAVGPVGAPA
jgi:glycosyltransferase involved in cell wall biosynthesis